ncbi:hypothetical protein BD779DRAFT_1474512 [Infundibulicybe gibba]|nr:hypothetical protein BD779DRAFT_1474512 [Infundibulicybe gibba]
MQLEKQLEVLQEKLERFEKTAVRLERVVAVSRGPDATTKRQHACCFDWQDQFELGAKMIVDAVLLMVAEMSTDIDGTPVAIFPKMQIAAGGVSVVNPITNFQARLTGDISYGLYTNTQESWQSRCEDEYLDDSMPEAISQAIVLCEVAKKEVVRFCLSDGQNWIFSLLTKDKDGNRVCFQGEVFEIITPRPRVQRAFEEDVRQIVTLVYHWLFTNNDPLSDLLYTLEVIE